MRMRTHAHAHAHAHTHLPTACVCACTSVCSQSLALSDSGVAYSWGWGESGSTGHGERTHRLEPTPIAALADVRIVQASAGSGHSLFVSEHGVLYACGDFRYGKLGLGKIT